MIETHGLTKSYKKLKALDNVNLKVEAGDIYGFIGPNGAGKSTTFKILATLLKPDTGTATIDGIDVRHGGKVRGLIGYMPDTFGVYDDMTVMQYLDFFAAAYFIPARNRRKLIDDILELTDLAFKRKALVRSLSRGMQQRLGVARVLVHDPKVLILDEPASGLDPRARIELRELLKELSRMGKTIVISSHILAELSEICTRIGIIEQGELVFQGSREELNKRLFGAGNITIEVAPEKLAEARRALEKAPFTASVTPENQHLVLALNDEAPLPEEVARYLFEHDCPPRRFQPEDVSLEKAFMVLTRGKLA